MKTSWNLSHVQVKESDKEKLFELAEKKCRTFVNKWQHRKDYLEQPSVLKEALKEYEYWIDNYSCGGKLGYYTRLMLYLNQNDTDLMARNNKIQDRTIKMSNKLLFFEISIAKIKNKNVFLNSPKLAEYRNYLENVFQESKHILSEPEEKIMALKAQTSHDNWIRMVQSFLSESTRIVLTEKGEKKKISFSEIISLMNNKNKEVRDSSAKAFNDILTANVKIAEHELNSVISNKQADDMLRNFARPDSARLLHDSISEKIIDNLCDAVKSNFDIAKEYYKLKSKLLGLKKLEYHERNLPVGSIKNDYSYEEAVLITNNVLNSLDKEFGEYFMEFVNGKIDVYPKQNKMMGAFCISQLPEISSYILLNFTGEFEDILTLAHETGHALHNEFSRQKHGSLTLNPTLSTAEVASTFFEDFVTEHIYEKVSEKEKLSIIMFKLNQDISTIFRQIACYLFEKELHALFREKGYLSHLEIGKLFSSHMQNYMGEFVLHTNESMNWWVYWSHIRSFFYNYSYAFCLLISKTLQTMVRNDKNKISLVKKFLASGSSKSPENLFSDLGLDITDPNFFQGGILEVRELLEQAKELSNL